MRSSGTLLISYYGYYHISLLDGTFLFAYFITQKDWKHLPLLSTFYSLFCTSGLFSINMNYSDVLESHFIWKLTFFSS